MTCIFGGLKKLIHKIIIDERCDKMRTYAEKNKKQLKKKIRKMKLAKERFFKVIKGLKTPDKLIVEPIKEKVSLRALQLPEGHEGNLIGMNV